MRGSKTCHTVLLSLLLASDTAARHAYVSLHAAEAPSSSDSAVSPNAARLVLAQRLGLSDYHALDTEDSNILDFLNSYSDSSHDALFQDTNFDARERRKILFFLEGVEDSHALATKSSSNNVASGFRIDNPPSLDHNVRFVQDLTKQCHHKSETLKGMQCDGDSFEIPDELKNDNSSSIGCHTFLHSTLNKPEAGPVTTANIHEILTSLHSSARLSSAEVITVFLPPAPSKGLLKRSSEPATWGTYTVPRQAPVSSTENDVLRPSIDDDKPAKDRPNKGSGEDEDEPDIPDRPKRPSKSQATSSSAPTDTSPPKGILPQCYTSEAECNRVTHGCSGHGECKLAFDISHPSGKNKRQEGSRPGQQVSTKTKCYSCQCEPQKVEKEAKIKTTRWTGPACQKKDVSTEFWLLGAVTVGLIGVIGWAIGLLSSMGSQELPSVIGAGVAGLGARGK